MNNMITYAKQQMKTFQEEPINLVDSLILAWISYLRIPQCEKSATTFRGVALKNLYKAEYFEELFHNVYEPEQAQELFTSLCSSPRFRDMKILKYTQQLNASQEKQFSALTLQFDKNKYFVSFRGTDSTIVGWKEDFNMFFECPVPSQIEAGKYVKHILKYTNGDLYLGGHSKGGNLAAYAAAINNQKRILQIYMHDAPGFLPEIVEQQNFQDIVQKTTKIVPQSSFFGMVLEDNVQSLVIQSNRKSFWQHDPFSWEIENFDFKYETEVNNSSKYVNKAFQNWLKGISPGQREQFIDLWYNLIQSTNSKTTSELQENWLSLLKAVSDIDEEAKECILQVTKSIVSIGIKTALNKKSETL